MNEYAIVRFMEEDGAPGIVCSSWIIDDEERTYYPQVKTNEIRDRLLKKKTAPTDKWDLCHIKILNYYCTFNEARRHLSRAEDTSHLESEEEEMMERNSRKRRTKFMQLPGEEESEEEFTPIKKQSAILLPPFPKVVPSTPQSSPFLPLFPKESATVRAPVAVSMEMATPPPMAASPAAPAATPGTSQKYFEAKMILWMGGVMDILREIQSDVRDIKIKQGCHPQAAENEELEFLHLLPIDTIKDFMHMDQRVCEDQNARYVLIKVLASVGGKDFRALLYNALRRLMTDEVAIQFSLTGKVLSAHNSKLSFLKTEMCKTLFTACRKAFPDATDDKMKTVAGDFLHQAKVRITRRSKKSSENENNNV